MKDILLKNGFIYKGYCRICGGQAELFKRGNVECKVRSRAMRFELIINNTRIKGRASELEMALNKYL